MPAVLEVSALVKRFGDNRAVDGASFTVATGSITGLIGPNGAGKTTCFNCITGFCGRTAGPSRSTARTSPGWRHTGSSTRG